MHTDKGFSLIEFLVVVALLGVISIFFYTPKTTKWNTEVSTAQSRIISLLKYYQQKSMRDGYKYYVRMDQDTTNARFEMEAYIFVKSNCPLGKPLRNEPFFWTYAP